MSFVAEVCCELSSVPFKSIKLERETKGAKFLPLCLFPQEVKAVRVPDSSVITLLLIFVFPNALAATQDDEYVSSKPFNPVLLGVLQTGDVQLWGPAIPRGNFWQLRPEPVLLFVL